MKYVKIPFNDWSLDKLRKGKKTCTSRYKKYGQIGDRFIAVDSIYELIGIYKLQLNYIIETFYKEEGADSPNELLQIWIDIHPKRGYRPNDFVYLHLFKKVEQSVIMGC